MFELKQSDSLPGTELSAAARKAPSPFRLKRILVPTDFSECSKQALRYALPFPKEFDASIYVLHVVHIHHPSVEAVDLNLPRFEAELRETCEKQPFPFAFRLIQATELDIGETGSAPQKVISPRKDK